MPLPSPPPELLQGASLFLDFDGTLVDLAPSPDAIRVTEGLRPLLAALADKLDGRVTLVSGRTSADVRAWLAPLALAVAGSHGLERDGETPVRANGFARSLARLHQVEAQYPGVLVEEKPLGAALHYRQAPDAEDACRIAADEAAALSGLSVQPGKMVFELKPATGDKGSAVHAIMAEPARAGTRPLFVGDDLTDEHGFAAAAALGGAGILVGPERPTAATYGLADVAAVHAWLEQGRELLA